MPGPYRYLPGGAEASLTVTPVFRWEQNRIYTGDDEEGEPDPNDPAPQRLWYYESGRADARRTSSRWGVTYSAQSPYDGRHFSLDELNNGFGSEVQTPSEAPYYSAVSNSSFMDHVMVKDTGGATLVRGQTRSLSVKISATATGLYSDDSREYSQASCSVYYYADVISFDLISRIKGDHDESDLYTDLRASGYYPASSARIAAGGFVTDEHEHEADIVMRIKRSGGNFGYGTTLPNVPRSLLPRLHIHNREGVEKPADSEEKSGMTDADGRVLSDVLTSRDLETHGGEGGDMSVSFSSDDRPARSIYLDWGETQWRMGENGEKSWNNRFLLLGGDYTEWVWAKVTQFESDENKPLLDHTMKLVVNRLQVRETNSETDAEQTTLYTTNQREANQYANNGDDDASFRVVYAPDLTDQVTRFVGLPGEMSDSGNGVYKGQFTIHKIAGVTIDKLNFALEDQGVYQLKG